jgi:molecular chaperone HtpG
MVTISPKESPWHALNHDIVIGKDILELLSSSMYVDPMAIYREYVQNAADSIDEARRAGFLEPHEAGVVHFRVDTTQRNVTIADNGIGVPHEDFAARLTAFGASKKRGMRARGFRGVGRLAGIGYCQELVFRSRTQGETKVSEIRWDCRKLKAILRANEQHRDLREAVNQVVELRRISANGHSSRFFEVEMRGIVRHRNDQLLNEAAITDYLAQVAPVPFRADFPFKNEILEHLGESTGLGNLQIIVGESGVAVRRPHGTGIEIALDEFDPYTDVELLKIEGIDGETACIGWLLHHGYTGALPASCKVRGLRARCGNVQIGDERMFEEIFPETRFNAWSVGEIHVIDPRIVPNGRRDHFEQNVHFNNVLTHLAPFTREISRKCRTSSIQRKLARDFDLRESALQQKIAILRQGALKKEDRRQTGEGIKAGLVFLDQIITKGILPSVILEELKERKQRLKRKAEKVLQTTYKASAFRDIAPAKRRAYEELIGLIYECSSNQANARLLVEKILSRIA